MSAVRMGERYRSVSVLDQMDRGRWSRDDFDGFARWFVDWIGDERPCRCFVTRGEHGRLAFFDLQPAFAWLQHSRQAGNQTPELAALFVEWTAGTELTIESEHFCGATADDDTEVVVELFSRPHIVMRFIRQ